MARICGICNTERMFTLTRGDETICVDCHNKGILIPQAGSEAGSAEFALLCGGGCIAEKGGDLCDGECAKHKIKNLFRYLDSFKYENDETNVAQIKMALDRDT